MQFFTGVISAGIWRSTQCPKCEYVHECDKSVVQLQNCIEESNDPTMGRRKKNKQAHQDPMDVLAKMAIRNYFKEEKRLLKALARNQEESKDIAFLYCTNEQELLQYL